MRNRKSISLITTLAVLHTAACILSGSLNWYNQLLVVNIAGIATTWFLHKKFQGSLWIILIVILPFYLIYVPFSIYLKSYHSFPIWISGIISCVSSYLLARFNTAVFWRIILLLLVPLAVYVFVMPNNFAHLNKLKNLSRYQIEQAIINDEAGMPVDIQSLKGKVVLLDIWNSTCVVCIRKFPVLQSLHDKYANDSSVKIFTLNIPLERDRGRKPDRFTKPYTFEKLYFSSQTEADKFPIEAVPLVLIFDKNMNCRYAGDLNLGWNIFIGNADRIIKKLKSEK